MRDSAMTEPQPADNASIGADTPSSRSLEEAAEYVQLAKEGFINGAVLAIAAALDAARTDERERVIAEFAGDLVSQFATVRAEERERCARIAEHFDQLPPATIASAIRNENIGESEERTSAHER